MKTLEKIQEPFTEQGLEALAEMLGVEDPAIAALMLAMPPMAGGAENFTDQGLTYILNTFPRVTQTPASTLYLGAFTAATASTVPGRTVDLGNPGTNVNEPAAGTGGYARASVASTAWAAPASNGSGMRTTASQTSFAETTAAWSPSTVNGFFVTQQLAQGAGSIGFYYANFDDVTAVNLNAAGYTLRITPFWHYDI